MSAAEDEYDRGELPSCPRHGRCVGETEVAEEWSTEYPRGSSQRARHWVKPQDPAEVVSARTSDDKRDEDLDPQDGPDRRDVADERGQTEHR